MKVVALSTTVSKSAWSGTEPLLPWVLALHISVESIASLNPAPFVQLSVTIPGLAVAVVRFCGAPGAARDRLPPEAAACAILALWLVIA